MSSFHYPPHSLRLRITLSIGLLVAILMAAISISIIFTWRSMILENEVKNARNLSRAFSIPILDALIWSENNIIYSEPQIRSQIDDFIEKVENIRFIILTDTDGQILAHSDPSLYGHSGQLPGAYHYEEVSKLLFTIYKNARYGWIIETIQPLQISGKRWGTLQIGIDANPIRREIRILFIRLYFFTILLIGVTMAVLYVLVGRMTHSLKDLITLVDKVDIDSEEFMNIKFKDDEIGYLYNHFRDLELRLKESRNDLLNAQRQIYQAEKLASIGRLSSGVAHEINNPLNGIKSCLYSINKWPEDTEKRIRYIELMSEGVMHIEAVVQKLLGFARQQSRNIHSFEINHSIGKVLALIEYRIQQRNIEIKTEFSDLLPPVVADEQNIQEVIMNLLLNAMDAVSDNGIISIRTGFDDNNLLFIEIEDNGTGIPAEDLERIFDPFYTTKDEGKGTGLGLSVSLGIIESYKGRISVLSQTGAGAKFRIQIPVGAE